MELLTAQGTERTPTAGLLTGALLVAPPIYLLADVLYAVRGWDDPAAGAVHVLGAIGYTLVLLRIAAWSRGWLAAATLFLGIVGAAGNVAYGFNTIHVSLGGVDLVDAGGPGGALIKPLGLIFPLSLVLVAVVLAKLGTRVSAVLVGIAALAWPVAHIGNIGWLAVGVNTLLVLALAPLARTGNGRSKPGRIAGHPM